MSRSYQGLGFTFEGEDDGLSRSLTETIKGFRSIEDLLPSMHKSFEQSSDSASSFSDNLKKMYSEAQNVYSQATSLSKPLTLSSEWEDRMTALDKDLRKIGRNAGLTGKELSKFKGRAAGMSVALKISGEEAAEASIAWSKAQSELIAVGIDSDTTLAKFANVSGVAASDLSKYLKTLRKEFQFTDKDMKKVTSSFLALGDSTGDTDGALKDMLKTTEQLRLKARGFGIDLPNEELAKFVAGSASLAKAFYSVSGNAEEARATAQEFSMTMLKARKGWLDSFAGMGDGFDEMFKSVGEGFGDVGIAMDSMKQGPNEFMATMAKMVSVAKKNGQDLDRPLAFVQAKFDKAFGEETSAKMIALFRNADQATLDSMATIKEGTKDLGKYAKEGFTAGWTLSEQFDHTKTMLVQDFRTIGKSAAKDFVGRAGPAFREFGAELKAIGKEGGPMGQVVRKMSEMHHIGAMALIPEALRPQIALFGTLSETLNPVMEQFKGLGSVLKGVGSTFGSLATLLGPKGTILAGIVALGAGFASLTGEQKGLVEDMAKGLIKRAGDIAYALGEMIATAVDKIPGLIDSAEVALGSFFDSVGKSVGSSSTSSRWSKLWTKLLDVGLRAFKSVGSAILKFGEGFWKQLTGQFDPASNMGFSKAGAGLAAGLQAAWDWGVDVVKNTLWPAVKTFVGDLVDGFVGNIDPKKNSSFGTEVGTAISNAISFAWDWILDSTPQVLASVNEFTTNLWDGFVGAIAGSDAIGVSDTLGAKIGSGIETALSSVVQFVGGLIRDNPKMAGLITFAAGGFNPVSAVAGLSVFLAGKGLQSTGYVTETEAKYVAGVWVKGMRAAGLENGESYAAGMRDGIDKAVKGAGQEGYIGKELAKETDSILKNAIERETKFMLQAPSDIDRRWREQGVQQLLAWTGNLDKVTSAWSSTFHKTNEEALHDIRELLRTGEGTAEFFAKMQQVEGAGFLKDLQVDFKYTAEESAAMNAVLKKNIDEVYAAGVSKMGDLSKSVTSFRDSWTTSLPLVGEAATKLKDTFGLKTTPAAAPGVPTQEAPLFKYNKEEYKGYRDMISKQVGKVAKELDEPTKKTVEDVLVRAFQNAYNKVDLDTKTFADKQVKVLAKVSTDVETSMRNMWMNILKSTALATEAISKDVNYIAMQLKTVEIAFSAVNAARSAAAGTTAATETAQRAVREYEGTTYQDQMLEAVNWPSWYDDYKQLFEKNLATLTSAVVSSGAKPVPATPGTKSTMRPSASEVLTNTWAAEKKNK